MAATPLPAGRGEFKLESLRLTSTLKNLPLGLTGKEDARDRKSPRASRNAREQCGGCMTVMMLACSYNR